MGWESGDRLQAGKYEILGVIAKGSFGLIYKAKLLSSNRDVAIKTPLEEFKNDPRYQELLKRLQNEAKSLKQLSHPNIVKFWDDFEEKDTYCIVLDFIEGETLYSLVKSGEQPLPEAEAVDYIQQIGAALTYMHQNKGKVHRDTHPSNIMVRSDGTAILIDFGLTADVAIVTPTYMHHGHQNFAPLEQKEGSAKPSVDIYTLAAALYFAVTGEIPISAIDRQKEIGESHFKSPQELVPHLSDRINAAILKGVEIKAKDRPKTMANWLELLQMPATKQELDSASNTLQAVFTLITHTVPWGNPLALQRKLIPWGWLVWSATLYLSIGAILTALTVPRAISAGAVFLAIAWGLAIAGTWAITWLFSLTFVWLISVVVAIGFALASFQGILGWVWGVTVIIGTILVWLFASDRVETIFRMLVTAWSKSKDDLLRSFSPAHAFLILAGTNIGSFQLGRFLYNFLR
jgi:tRNA A-37 threonylcarbamoyl transferase component Bud32